MGVKYVLCSKNWARSSLFLVLLSNLRRKAVPGAMYMKAKEGMGMTGGTLSLLSNRVFPFTSIGLQDLVGRQGYDLLFLAFLVTQAGRYGPIRSSGSRISYVFCHLLRSILLGKWAIFHRLTYQMRLETINLLLGRFGLFLLLFPSGLPRLSPWMVGP